jgi:hypothetical protein
MFHAPRLESLTALTTHYFETYLDIFNIEVGITAE